MKIICNRTKLIERVNIVLKAVSSKSTMPILGCLILEVNNLSENDVLKEGAKLVIPSADITNAAALSSSSKNQISAASSVSKVSTKIYEVQKGDTLYGIARKSGIKVPELLSLNNFDSNMTLKIGQKIKIPASENSYVQAQPAVSKTDVKKAVEANIKTAQKNSVNTTVSISSGVQWPLSNPVVKNLSGKISGVILTGKNNEAVKCVHEGTVMYNGVYRGFGEVVFIHSKTGKVRKLDPSSNWYDKEDTIDTNIYSKTPFITVTLNPADITKIREYNSKIGFKEFGCSNFKNSFLKIFSNTNFCKCN